MIRKLKLLVCVVLGALTLSCSDWLKVSSEDRIMENDLFRTPRGFMTALNGIYIDLLNSSMYGKTLTWGMTDIWHNTIPAGRRIIVINLWQILIT